MAPQILIGIALLIWILGYSALVGLAVRQRSSLYIQYPLETNLTNYCTDPHGRRPSTVSVPSSSSSPRDTVHGNPLTPLTRADSDDSAWMFAKMLSYRSTQQSHVDTRIRLISEVINHIRAVKLYGYQTHFAQAVSGLRRKELEELRRSGFVRAAMAGLGYFIPTLAAVSEWGHKPCHESIRMRRYILYRGAIMLK